MSRARGGSIFLGKGNKRKILYMTRSVLDQLAQKPTLRVTPPIWKPSVDVQVSTTS